MDILCNNFAALTKTIRETVREYRDKQQTTDNILAQTPFQFRTFFFLELLKEREDRERKKRRLAEELDHCIRLQNQWKAIQKFIEMEEDRLIEECQLQRRRLSQMQQQERKEKAEKLASIRHRLQKALEGEEVEVEAALEEKAEREAAERRHKDLTQLQKEQTALLEERRQLKKLEFAEKEEERRMEELRQQAEDEAIAEEKRRILEQS
ncbi:hypothetical protein OUZ56_006133 [Daphnia magna]|uniref:Meiosis-specific nuclear structural protein 1 n=1 Tax=Daphnia magna TaxID=35525 RepID=A0ABQ9YVC9_9CRUS|nr:hypothetical protein OUZ56_006133 [Daphnia magna]